MNDETKQLLLESNQHVIIHGAEMSGKQRFVRNYLQSIGFDPCEKVEYKINCSNYIYSRYINNHIGSLFEFHWKDVFCNETILFHHIFNILQNTAYLTQKHSYLVIYNINLLQSSKYYLILYKCIDIYTKVNVILTATTTADIPYQLISRCQLIRFSAEIRALTSTDIEFTFDNIRKEVHKLLLNNFDYNKCIKIITDTFLKHSKEEIHKNILKKACECSIMCKNNENLIQYILEQYVYFFFLNTKLP